MPNTKSFMKLIGSKQEAEFREQLIYLHSLHCVSSKLTDVLLANNHPISNIMVLDWFEDEGDDVFEVLVASKYLVKVELDRSCPHRSFLTKLELSEYSHGLSKLKQIKLLVALELLSAEP